MIKIKDGWVLEGQLYSKIENEIGTPTYTYDLAWLLNFDMCETDKYRYYHATNAEVIDTIAG